MVSALTKRSCDGTFCQLQPTCRSRRPWGGCDETGTKIRLALETAGVEFIDENGGGPGVRLRKQHVKKG
jgi:hypothetical protein